ncbi:hypothetical protein EW146_g196 [Bondarzewia mesenterica]|uniref:Uncharacterized protein n=1 Tax=Bondarzewia mesenterica TaxID=1095465 RepID=A0A4S4M7R7_9AGAM|nr:hypothetical protein EW146_g196 [Bondarzewia mesenterica]
MKSSSSSYRCKVDAGSIALGQESVHTPMTQLLQLDNEPSKANTLNASRLSVFSSGTALTNETGKYRHSPNTDCREGETTLHIVPTWHEPSQWLIACSFFATSDVSIPWTRNTDPGCTFRFSDDSMDQLRALLDERLVLRDPRLAETARRDLMQHALFERTCQQRSLRFAAPSVSPPRVSPQSLQIGPRKGGWSRFSSVFGLKLRNNASAPSLPFAASVNTNKRKKEPITSSPRATTRVDARPSAKISTTNRFDILFPSEKDDSSESEEHESEGEGRGGNAASSLSHSDLSEIMPLNTRSTLGSRGVNSNTLAKQSNSSKTSLRSFISVRRTPRSSSRAM